MDLSQWDKSQRPLIKELLKHPRAKIVFSSLSENKTYPLAEALYSINIIQTVLIFQTWKQYLTNATTETCNPIDLIFYQKPYILSHALSRHSVSQITDLFFDVQKGYPNTSVMQNAMLVEKNRLLLEIQFSEHEMLSKYSRLNIALECLFSEDKYSLSFWLRKNIVNSLDRLVDSKEQQLQTHYPLIHKYTVHGLGVGFFIADLTLSSKYDLTSYVLTQWLTRLCLPSYNSMQEIAKYLGFKINEIKLIEFYPRMHTFTQVLFNSVLLYTYYDQNILMSAFLSLIPVLLQSIEKRFIKEYIPMLNDLFKKYPESLGILGFLNYYVGMYLAKKIFNIFFDKPLIENCGPAWWKCELQQHINNKDSINFRRSYRDWVRFFKEHDGENFQSKLQVMNVLYSQMKNAV